MDNDKYNYQIIVLDNDVISPCLLCIVQFVSMKIYFLELLYLARAVTVTCIINTCTCSGSTGSVYERVHRTGTLCIA